MQNIITLIARFGIRHERLLTLLGGAWFFISCAAWARFVDLPEIPFLTDRNAWIIAGAYNAIWWGFLKPAINRKRTQLAELEQYPDS